MTLVTLRHITDAGLIGPVGALISRADERYMRIRFTAGLMAKNTGAASPAGIIAPTLVSMLYLTTRRALISPRHTLSCITHLRTASHATAYHAGSNYVACAPRLLLNGNVAISQEMSPQSISGHFCALAAFRHLFVNRELLRRGDAMIFKYGIILASACYLMRADI